MTDHAAIIETAGEAHSLALTYDAGAYRHLLPDAAMTEEEQTRFLDAMWSVVVSFVDLGFGRHPVQQAMDVSKSRASLAADALAMVPCGTVFNDQSSIAAARRKTRTAGKKES